MSDPMTEQPGPRYVGGGFSRDLALSGTLALRALEADVADTRDEEREQERRAQQAVSSHTAAVDQWIARASADSWVSARDIAVAVERGKPLPEGVLTPREMLERQQDDADQRVDRERAAAHRSLDLALSGDDNARRRLDRFLDDNLAAVADTSAPGPYEQERAARARERVAKMDEERAFNVSWRSKLGRPL